MPIPVDINHFLGRKYALLQQQADAGTTTANANANAAGAAAGLDRARTLTQPAESAASVAQLIAQSRLLREQAAIVAPESRSRIRNQDATTENILVDTEGDKLMRTMLFSPDNFPSMMNPGSVPSMGPGYNFRFSADPLGRSGR